MDYLDGCPSSPSRGKSAVNSDIYVWFQVCLESAFGWGTELLEPPPSEARKKLWCTSYRRDMRLLAIPGMLQQQDCG